MRIERGRVSVEGESPISIDPVIGLTIHAPLSAWQRVRKLLGETHGLNEAHQWWDVLDDFMEEYYGEVK